jgi:hypothetical protein
MQIRCRRPHIPRAAHGSATRPHAANPLHTHHNNSRRQQRAGRHMTRNTPTSNTGTNQQIHLQQMRTQLQPYRPPLPSHDFCINRTAAQSAHGRPLNSYNPTRTPLPTKTNQQRHGNDNARRPATPDIHRLSLEVPTHVTGSKCTCPAHWNDRHRGVT